MTTPVLISRNTKSVGIAILLTLLLGPIGLFYASVLGGVIMSFLPIILTVLIIYGNTDNFLTLASWSVGLFLLLPGTYWLINVIWAVLSVNSHNREIEEDLRIQLQLMSIQNRRDANQIVVNLNQRAVELKTNSNEQIDSQIRPNIQDWLKSNPNKSINDYYVKFGR